MDYHLIKKYTSFLMLGLSIWLGSMCLAGDWVSRHAGDVHVLVPPSWVTLTYQPDPKSVSLLITSECPPKQCLVMVIVALEKHPLDVTSAQKYTQDIKNKSLAFSMQPTELKRVDQQPALRFTYTAKFAKITIKYITYMVPVGAETYFFTLSAPERNFLRFEADFEKMAKSVSFSKLRH